MAVSLLWKWMAPTQRNHCFRCQISQTLTSNKHVNVSVFIRQWDELCWNKELQVPQNTATFEANTDCNNPKKRGISVQTCSLKYFSRVINDRIVLTTNGRVALSKVVPYVMIRTKGTRQELLVMWVHERAGTWESLLQPLEMLLFWIYSLNSWTWTLKMTDISQRAFKPQIL